MPHDIAKNITATGCQLAKHYSKVLSHKETVKRALGK